VSYEALENETDVADLCTLAGLEVSAIKALRNSYNPVSHPEKSWWFVKTKRGWIEIGWRKRVISIDWSDTDIRQIITDDDVTKNTEFVHAWGPGKAIEYLRALAALEAAAGGGKE
jgi:hypothetical protein